MYVMLVAKRHRKLCGERIEPLLVSTSADTHACNFRKTYTSVIRGHYILHLILPYIKAGNTQQTKQQAYT